MNYKTGLISLSTMAALALLLPTHANALPSLEAADEVNPALTEVDTRTEGGVEEVAEDNTAVIPAADESLTAIAETLTPSEAPAPDLTAESAAQPEALPSADLNTEAPAADSLGVEANSEASLDLSNEAPVADSGLTENPLQPLSTSSRDLQQTEDSVASEDVLLAPLGQPLDVAQTTSDSASSNKWHFLLTPYVYIPLSISGSANFNNLNSNLGGAGGGIDFELQPNQIRTALRNNLNFAFFSGFEAWNPTYKLGVVSNFDYVSLSATSTVERDVRFPGLANFIPTQINAGLTTQLLRADLAGSYRFYDPARVNPEGIRSEYDLGPFVFDALGGLSVIQVNTRLGLNTNLGRSGQVSNSSTVVSPLIGGRVRWNANPKFALVGMGTISGFGIGGLMQYGLQGGIDWMFSGDTTLGAGYRAGFTDYNGNRIDVNVNQHGPYINIGFRF